MAFTLNTVVTTIAVPVEDILAGLGVAPLSELQVAAGMLADFAKLIDSEISNKQGATAATIQAAIGSAELGADALEAEKFPKP